MTGLALVHLARRQNGVEPFARFLYSYRAHPAGAPHELVILFKGFPGERGTEGHDALLEGLPHRRLFVPDHGFDIDAYFAAVARLDHAYFCFLNSFSRILDDGWLAKLQRWAGEPGVGLAGASGSAQRMFVAPADRRASAALVRGRAALASGGPAAFARRASLWALRRAGLWRPERHFPPFPNYHLRTNAFMGGRAVLSGVRVAPMRTKLSAYRLESGHDSLTRQVQALGLRVLVVGRDGEGYEPERWHLSNTFWQSREENLLVADNQTEAYIEADPARRAELAESAWGAGAKP